MDLWDLTKLVFRRWYWALPGLLLTMLATGAIVVGLEPDYVATSHVQLVPPQSRPVEFGEPTLDQRNPWVGLGLYSLANAAVVAVEEKNVADSLKAAGLSDAYTVRTADYTALVTFEVTGDTEQQALDTSDKLMAQFRATVRSLQTAMQPVADTDLVTVQRIDSGSNVEESTGTIKRAAVAVTGLGMLLTVAFVIWMESLARWRARRAGIPADADAAPRVMPTSPPAMVAPSDPAGEPPTAPLGIRTSPQPDQTVVLPRWRNGQRRGAGVEAESRKP